MLSADGGTGARPGAFSRCDPDYGVGKERSDVFTLYSLLVSAHQDELLAQASAERLARNSRIVRPNRLASVAKSAWSFFTGPAERPTVLPRLTDYPYRSWT
jgi:hypothetical protein